jgi:hypothetical protein
MTVGIFLIGAVVSVMVLGALALLFYGAVLDGREDDQPIHGDGSPVIAEVSPLVAPQARTAA